MTDSSSNNSRVDLQTNVMQSHNSTVMDHHLPAATTTNLMVPKARIIIGAVQVDEMVIAMTSMGNHETRAALQSAEVTTMVLAATKVVFAAGSQVENVNGQM